MIDDGVVPILMAMTSGTSYEVVTYLLLEESFVYGFVYAEEEIIYPTIDDDSQGTIFQTVKLVDDRVIVPCLEVFVTFAKVCLHPPIVGEGADVEPSARTAYGSKYILVTDGQPHGAVSAHTESGNGTFASVGQGSEVLVHIVYQLV